MQCSGDGQQNRHMAIRLSTITEWQVFLAASVSRNPKINHVFIPLR